MQRLKAVIQLIILFSVFCSVTVFARDDLRIVEQRYYYDATNAMSFENVQQQAFTQYSGILTQGYHSGTFWLKLKLTGTDLVGANQNQELPSLLIQPTYLDSVEIFDTLGNAKHLPIGQKHDWHNSEISGLTFGYKIPATPSTRTIYLKVKTDTTYIVDVELVNGDQANEFVLRVDVLLHSLTIALMMLFLLSLIYWVLVRDRMMGNFVLKQGMAWMYGLTLAGYHRLYLFDVVAPEFLALSTKWVIALYVLASAHFHYQFLSVYKPKRLFMKGMFAFFAISILGIGILMMGYMREALLLTKIIAILLPVWMILLVHFGVDWKRIENEKRLLGRPIMLFFHWLMLLLLLLASVPTVGYFATWPSALCLSLLHGVVTGLILLVMVNQQQVLTSRHHLSEALRAQSEAEIERSNKEKQAQFMSMLTHELRTPLSVLRLALPNKSTVELTGRAKVLADQAIDDMHVLINHCTQLDKLDQGLQPITIQNVRVDAFLENVRERFAARLNLRFMGDAQLTVSCDPTLLQIIFNNLLDNAIKYGTPAGDITVHVEPVNEQSVRIGVQNQISPQVQLDSEDLFKKFYRDASAQQVSGTGLGLYIVRAMCELMYGRAYADVSVAQHITVWVELPLA